MKGKSKKSVNVVYIGIGLAVLFWLLESFIHFYLFRERNLAELIFTPHIHEFWMRLVIAGLFVTFGFYAQSIINKCQRTEKELQESMKFNSTLLTSSPTPIFVANADQSIKYMNPAMEKMTGHALDEIIGRKPPYPWWTEETLSETSNDLAKAVKEGAKGLEKLFKNKNGERFWVEITSTPVKQNNEINYYIASWIDITQRKRAQKELEENELFYRNLTESVSDGVMLIQDSEITFVNHAFGKLFDCDQAEKFVGLNAAALFNNEYEDVFVKIFDVKKHDRDIESLPQRFCFSKKGHNRWIGTDIKDMSLKSRAATLIVFKDITAEMLRELAVQEEAEQIRQENVRLRASIKERFRFGNIIGKSPVMQEVYELTLKAAATDANVSIIGESGTGKELIARAVHDMSSRAEKAFVPINCGAIPENLIESEFFGHVKGAFTGAHINKNGYLHLADGGTLFLDEVGELGLKMQAKLLRALDGGEYVPIGSTHFKKSKFRVISATNRDISEMVNQGLMREDFYYRLNVIPITLPPLRERQEDIPLLIEHFLQQYNDGKTRTLSGKTIGILCNYDWPGNVRELQNNIQRYLAVGEIDILKMNNNNSKSGQGMDASNDFKNAVIDFEKRYILRALNQNEWNRSTTAAALKIDVKTLFTKMKKTGLMRRASG